MNGKRINIGILAFLLLGVVPFAAAFIYALLYSLGMVGVLSDGFTLVHWQQVIRSGEFFSSLGYSASIALLATTLSVSGALWVVLSFKDYLEQQFLSFVLYLPLAVPGVVAAFFTFQLFAKAGFFSRLAFKMGFIEEAGQFPDLVNDTFAVGIVLTFVTVVLPFFVLLFLNVYKNERIADLAVLAQSLGARKTQITQRIVLPILLGKTKTLIVLYFVFLLGAYEIPLILGQESPQMLSVLIIRETKQYDLSKIAEGYVVAVIYTTIVSIAAVALFLPRKKTSI